MHVVQQFHLCPERAAHVLHHAQHIARVLASIIVRAIQRPLWLDQLAGLASIAAHLNAHIPVSLFEIGLDVGLDLLRITPVGMRVHGSSLSTLAT